MDQYIFKSLSKFREAFLIWFKEIQFVANAA